MPILGVIASSFKKTSAIGYFLMSGNLNLRRFNMETETITSDNLGAMTNNNSLASANSGVAGYLSGGLWATTVQKFLFSSGAISTLSSLPEIRAFGQGTQNSGTASYLPGGANTGFDVRYTTVVKMPYSTETSATLGSSFTKLGNGNGSFANSHTAAYTAGGYDDASPGPGGHNNAINKIVFSTDTFSNSVAVLTAVNGEPQSGSNDGTAGYMGGGTQAATGAIQKIVYSTDTKSVISAVYSAKIYRCAVVFKYQVSMYLIGGKDSNDAPITTIQKLIFSSETVAAISPSLSVADSSNTVSFSDNGVY